MIVSCTRALNSACNAPGCVRLGWLRDSAGSYVAARVRVTDEPRSGRRFGCRPACPPPSAHWGRRNVYTRSTKDGLDLSPAVDQDQAASVSAEQTGDVLADSGDSGGAQLLALVPGHGTNGDNSPFKDAPWQEVLEHIGQRLYWTDESLSMQVISLPADPNPEILEEIAVGLKTCDIAVGVGLQMGWGAEWLSSRLSSGHEEVDMPPTMMFLDSHEKLSSICRAGGQYVSEDDLPDWRVAVAELELSFDKLAKTLKVKKLVQELWNRHSSDDLLYALLILVNEYVKKIPLVAGQLKDKTDLKAILCMMGNCREQVLNCVNDPECKAGLDCLEQCALNDQVCSYRCIVSHESPLFEAFSLCILQKNNCLGNSAPIPMRPKVDAMTHFRGEQLTWETAEELFIGWLGTQPSSWRVVAGVNPAYDYFPCQYQLFYKGKAKGSMWYEPVFKVTRYDGETVWRRRKYRMRRAEVPGTYHFSVLDNGVISAEYWRIVDVPDDLSWGLFYYSGAASVVGQTYQGAVFVTRDGLWPDEKHNPRIEAALNSAGIKMWELYIVDQTCCCDEEAPLEIKDMRPFDSLV